MIYPGENSPRTNGLCCLDWPTTPFSRRSKGARSRWIRRPIISPNRAEPSPRFILHGQLRGCVGYVLPVSPVYRAVADTARAAAFEDTRFCPVTLLEARELEIELSILSPPQSIPAEAIEIGRHGLLITMAGHRGLLLPQVPTEHNWDRTTFLEQTCRKAGLPAGCVEKRRNDRGLHRGSIRRQRLSLSRLARTSSVLAEITK